jgi:hypothetical protein
LNLLKSFKISKSGPGHFSKVASVMHPAFQKENCLSDTYLAVFKTGEIGPAQFSKAFGAAPRNLLSNRNTAIELAGFQKLCKN